ncbi:MAG: SIMPL domain-containing protein [Patescibacteria group bacterium]
MNNNKEQLWSVGKWAGVLLVIFLAVVSIKEFVSIKYVGKPDQYMNTISVNGKGEAISIPDIATFSFSVTETAKTVAEAQTKATEKTSAALVAIKAGGVEEKDIKTLSYSINPDYEYTSGICTPYQCGPSKQTLKGYVVSQTIEVKVRDLSKAGALFETIGAAGVQNVNGLAVSIDEIESVKAVARAEAIADAKTKAEKIAKDLGVRLVRITSFYDQSDNGPYYDGRAMNESMSVSAVKAQVAPEIPTGEQKITSNVTITYEIR